MMRKWIIGAIFVLVVVNAFVFTKLYGLMSDDEVQYDEIHWEKLSESEKNYFINETLPKSDGMVCRRLCRLEFE